MSNADVALAFFQSKGLTKAQAAGIVGNLKQESNVNPTDSGGGIAQWGGSRYTALQSYAASTGQSATSLSAQLGFLWSELSSSYPGTLAALKKTTTPAAAAVIISNQYERPGIPDLGNRIKYAEQADSSSGGSSLLGKLATAALLPLGPVTQIPALAGEVLGGTDNPITGVVNAVDGAVSWATELGKFLAFLTSASGWDRVLKVGGGGLLILMALNELVKAGGVNPAGVIATGAKAIK